MGRFRDRTDDDLRIRGYSANTRASDLRCVRQFVRHFMRSPDQLTPEHIRQYQLHLTRDQAPEADLSRRFTASAPPRWWSHE